VTTRRLYIGVALAGFLSITLATAFVAHVVLEAAQSVGLLTGDYGRHAHDAVFPIGLAAAALALCGVLLYALHLAAADGRSLPLLARSIQTRIGWRAVALTAVGACLVLLGMETAEQLASGRLDGIASAFDGAPLAGLGLILFISAFCHALAWSFCNWLANAHARLVLAVAFLLRWRRIRAASTARRAKRAALTTFDYTWDVSQTHGKRAPPCLAS
jgi:hypothetical protein